MITGEFVELACTDRSCAPPPVGTGGSKPSVGGVQDMDRLISDYEGSASTVLSPKLRVPNVGVTNTRLRDEVKVANALRLGSQLRGKVDWDEFKGYDSMPMSPGDYASFVGRMRTDSAAAARGAEPPFTMRPGAYQKAFEEGRVREFADEFEKTMGFPFETVLADGVSHAWIMGAGVEPTKLVQMQRVAAEILPQNGDPAPADIKNFDETLMPKDATWIPEGAMRTVMRQIYDNTQADLAERGVDEVTLVRGVRLPGGMPETREAEVDVQMRPLSSYATNHMATIPFLPPRDPDNMHAATIITKVPRKYVFATPYQGPASWDESEVTVLGGTHRSTLIEWSDSLERSELVEFRDAVNARLDA